MDKIKRGQDRRKGQALFYDAIANRRRQDYERRGRTTALPVPTAMLFRRDVRRFEESGTE